MIPEDRIPTHPGVILSQEFLGTLNTTPEFWNNLQTALDLARSRPPRAVQRLAAVG